MILSSRITPASLHSSPFVASLLCSLLRFYILSISFIMSVLALHSLIFSSPQGLFFLLSLPPFYPNPPFILVSLQFFYSLQIINRLFLSSFSILVTSFFLQLSSSYHIWSFSYYLEASHFTSLSVFF